jgi:hypothetical protein
MSSLIRHWSLWNDGGVWDQGLGHQNGNGIIHHCAAVITCKMVDGGRSEVLGSQDSNLPILVYHIQGVKLTRWHQGMHGGEGTWKPEMMRRDRLPPLAKLISQNVPIETKVGLVFAMPACICAWRQAYLVSISTFWIITFWLISFVHAGPTCHATSFEAFLGTTTPSR